MDNKLLFIDERNAVNVSPKLGENEMNSSMMTLNNEALTLNLSSNMLKNLSHIEYSPMSSYPS